MCGDANRGSCCGRKRSFSGLPCSLESLEQLLGALDEVEHVLPVLELLVEPLQLHLLLLDPLRHTAQHVLALAEKAAASLLAVNKAGPAVTGRRVLFPRIAAP